MSEKQEVPNQVGKMLGQLIEHQKHRVKKVVPPKILSGLLEQVGKPVRLPAVERFVARDKLKVDINGELPISYLSDNIRNNFMDVVEENVKAVTLKQRKMLKSSVDGPILAALGDKNIAEIKRAKIAFAHAFEFLKTADRTKWFIFYVPDAKGTVWAVGAYWRGGGWCIGARSVESPDEWRAGDQVVSR